MILETTYRVLSHSSTVAPPPSSMLMEVDAAAQLVTTRVQVLASFIFGFSFPSVCVCTSVTLFIQPSHTEISSDSSQRNTILFCCLHSALSQRISVEIASTLVAVTRAVYRKGNNTFDTNLGLILV